MTVTTGSPVHGGYVLARPEGMGVLFVRWALPGEVVSVRLVGRKREYAFTEAVEVLSPSARRVDPPCEVFGECGGCQLQHADYPYQLEMKREILREAFRRIGEILEELGVSAGARLLDLYAGAGNFALPLAAKVREIVAVEGEGRSFKELRGNVRENALGNVRVVRSSVETYRPEGRFDALVLDPPRAGLSERALARVRRIAAGNVLYVSCNPATLARDVRSLSDRYDLASLEMHDFFPNTHHVEALAVLTIRA